MLPIYVWYGLSFILFFIAGIIEVTSICNNIKYHATNILYWCGTVQYSNNLCKNTVSEKVPVFLFAILAVRERERERESY